MKLTDSDAAFIADYLRADAIKMAFGMEPDEVKNDVQRYDTPAGTFFIPVKGTCRPNKALDALYKLSCCTKKSVLQTAFELIDEASLAEVL